VNIVENTSTRLVMKDNGKTNPWIAWGWTIVGAVGTIVDILILALHHADMSPVFCC
jgi:hypothetical protein